MLALIRRTVASDTSDDEFNLFLNTARYLRLDPLRRQVMAIVYSKDNPQKRRMSIITGIDGLRTIADRSNAYRPDEDEPSIEIDHSLKGPTNPAGIIKAAVRVWKFSHNSWHKITGAARWEEYCPLTEEWAYKDGESRKSPTGVFTLDKKSNWFKMPTVMISKCAEAVALRKGWPDDLANLYEAAEIDRASTMDLLPSEAAEEGAREERQERLGMGRSLLMVFDDNGNLESVPYGQVADRCFAFIKENREEPSKVLMWRERNRAALKEFWAQSPNDANAVKSEIEKVME
jgi:phage recombination protein Bet